MDAAALPSLGADAVPKDNFGTEFRPGFHRTNTDGSPFRGARGQFMPKGGRRKTPVETASNPPEASTGQPPADSGAVSPAPTASPAAVEAPRADFSDVAKIVAEAKTEAATEAKPAAVEVVEGLTHEGGAEVWIRGSYALLDRLFSGHGEWQPQNASEHAGIKDTLVAWQRARGWKPLPPGGGFIMAVVAFVSARLSEPKTARTIVRFFPGLASWLGVEQPKPAEQRAAKAVPEKPATAAAQPPASASAADDYFGSHHITQ